jgi:hypothetical protein
MPVTFNLPVARAGRGTAKSQHPAACRRGLKLFNTNQTGI